MPTIENYGTIANQYVTIGDITRTLADWARDYNLPYTTVAMRWKRGHRDPAKLFYKRAPISPIVVEDPEFRFDDPDDT